MSRSKATTGQKRLARSLKKRLAEAVGEKVQYTAVLYGIQEYEVEAKQRAQAENRFYRDVMYDILLPEFLAGDTVEMG